MSYGAIDATHDDAADTDSDDDTRDTMILILISWVALRDTIMEILILIGWGALRGAGRVGRRALGGTQPPRLRICFGSSATCHRGLGRLGHRSGQ